MFCLLAMSLDAQVNKVQYDKSIINVFTLELSDQIVNPQLEQQFQAALVYSIQSSCPNIEVRTDFGYNNKQLSKVEKIELEREVRELAIDLLKARTPEKKKKFRKKILKKVDSDYLFLGNVDYISHKGVFKLFFEILDLETLASTYSGTAEWDQNVNDDQQIISKIKAELDLVPICGITSGSIDNLKQLRKELREYARALLVAPSDASFRQQLKDYVYSDPKLYQLFLAEYEIILENKIDSLLPEESLNDLTKENKVLILYYLGELERIINIIIIKYPNNKKLKTEYEKRLEELYQWKEKIEGVLPASMILRK
jgi:hypothetical protein